MDKRNLNEERWGVVSPPSSSSASLYIWVAVFLSGALLLAITAYYFAPYRFPIIIASGLWLLVFRHWFLTHSREFEYHDEDEDEDEDDDDMDEDDDDDDDEDYDEEQDADEAKPQSRAQVVLPQEVQRPSERWFEVLGVAETATLEEIRAARNAKIKLYHENLTANLGPEIQEVAKRRSQAINAAYEEATTKRT